MEKGALISVHVGVYRAGHRAPSVYATYMAAVLACGGGAALSGRAAAHLWGLTRGKPAPPVVTAPTERQVRGVHTIHSKNLDPRDITLLHLIPITSVPRTLIDLAATLPRDALALACHEAGVRHQTTPAHVEEVLSRRPNATGAAKLRSIINGDVHVTLSKLERRFLELLRAHNLPLPITNRPAGGRRVDCRWPQFQLTVELDSYTYHRSRHAWEKDRRREREAYARGDQFRRYTWDDVFSDPAPMLRELRAILTEEDVLDLGSI